MDGWIKDPTRRRNASPAKYALKHIRPILDLSRPVLLLEYKIALLYQLDDE